jgi:hypothetical protein
VFTTRLISSIEVAIEGPMMNARRSSGKRCAVPVLKLVGRDVLAGGECGDDEVAAWACRCDQATCYTLAVRLASRIDTVPR